MLSKFPVVQHFPFGSLFAWDRDPNAKSIQASVHTSSQPKSSTVPSSTSSTSAYSSPRPQPQLRNSPAEPSVHSASSASSRPHQQPQPPLRDPLSDVGAGATAAPWTKAPPAAGPGIPRGPNQPTRAPWAHRTPSSPPTTADMASMTAPWARGNAAAGKETLPGVETPTRAPWTEKKPL